MTQESIEELFIKTLNEIEEELLTTVISYDVASRQVLDAVYTMLGISK